MKTTTPAATQASNFRRRSQTCALACGVAVAACSTTSRAINIVLDYTYDTQNFFGAGNPDGAAAGAAAKNTLQAAATFFSDLLEDTFSPITLPAPYNSQVSNGQATWDWNRFFSHPGTGSNLTLSGPVAQDEYRIYAGGRSLSGNTLGRGGPGGFNWSQGGNGGGFTSQEITEINAITAGFSDAVENRGEPDGFSRWGGVVSFDNDGTANWHFDHNATPTGSDDDFFSVALHEIGHSLGLGASNDWNAFISGGTFTGAKAVASYGGPVPADTGHWTDGINSVLRGTTTVQETAMDPIIQSGTRKVFTELDIAALDDIGWDIAALVAGITGDFNNSGQVEQGDLDLVLQNWGDDTNATGIPAGWTNDNTNLGQIEQTELDRVLQNWGSTSAPDFSGSAVPEPTTLALLSLGGLATFRRRA